MLKIYRWIAGRLPCAIARRQQAFLVASFVSLVVAAGIFAVPPVWAKNAPVTVSAAGDIAFCERSLVAPMDPESRLDPEHGLHSFVVGTGGGQLKPQISVRHRGRTAGSLMAQHGGLELTPQEESYAWRFVLAGGHSFEDSGRALCVKRKPASRPGRDIRGHTTVTPGTE